METKIVHIDKKRTVVLSLDVENALVAATEGIHAGPVLQNIAAIHALARAHAVELIHVSASARADFKDAPRFSPLWQAARQRGSPVTGTEGAALHPMAKAEPGELVLHKTCVNPFLTTGLQQALVNADCRSLILVGLWTNFVIESTARHASDLGYDVYVVSDACASNSAENHRFAIERILPNICSVVDRAEVDAAFAS